MQNFVNFLKENYSYFVYAFEFVLSIVCAVLALIQRFHSKKVRLECDYLSDMNDLTIVENRFYCRLPEWIQQANVLYPYHGDGQKRFDYVYQKALDLFKEDPSELNRNFVSDCVDEILCADKLEKISRDTQVVEPKKEFYEKDEDETIEGSQDLRHDGEENQSAERSACYVSRRD